MNIHIVQAVENFLLSLCIELLFSVPIDDSVKPFSLLPATEKEALLSANMAPL